MTTQRSWIMEGKELAQRLQQQGASERIAIADCRFWLSEPSRGKKAFEEGHLPGAVYFDLNEDLSSPVEEHGGRHPLPDPVFFANKLSKAGITPDSTVVLYDEQGGSMASRMWWLLQWVGHSGEAYVLDGGYGAWKQADYPVEEGDANQPTLRDESVEEKKAHIEGSYPVKLRPELVVTMNEVRDRLHEPSVRLIDSRELPRYLGELEPIDPKAGHIPGAVNRFWMKSLNEAGQWKASEEQKPEWDALIGDAKEIIVYCGSGVTACPNVLSLWQAGYTHAKLYAGSWSDWVSYEENPVGTGEE